MTAEEKSARDTSGWRSWLKRYWNRLVKEVVVHGGGGAGAGAGAGGTKEGKEIAAMAVRKVLTARSRSMQRCNPHTVLRKHMLQTAVEHAEAGDFAHVTRLHQLLRDPFTQDTVIQLSFHGGKSGYHPFSLSLIINCSCSHNPQPFAPQMHTATCHIVCWSLINWAQADFFSCTPV
jgi:hypothetical protein